MLLLRVAFKLLLRDTMSQRIGLYLQFSPFRGLWRIVVSLYRCRTFAAK